MAQLNRFQMHTRLLPVTVMGASFGVSLVEKVNSVLLGFLAFLLFVTSWRFFRLIRGEHKLRRIR